MALSLDEALGMSLADEVDESIHVNVNTRQITIPESQQLFGVESDADVEVKHIIIDGRYANGNRDLSKLAWRVIYRNANKETSYYLIPSVVANENSIEMDWLIKRSVVAYKGTVDFILCAFATTSSVEVTPEWNSTLGQGIVLEGLETSAIDIGKESVDELSKILYETITARDAAANSAEDAYNTANSIKDSMTQIAVNKEAVSQLKEELDTVKQQVTNITPDDSTVGEKPWSSKNIVDMLCPPLEESGNPVVCYPVAGYPLGVKAKWEPVQEGSGTPSPENIRPIKGRNSVRVERCGENLLPFGERIENIYQQHIMTSDDLLLLSKACAGQEVTLTFSVETQNIVFNDAVDEEWRKRIGFEFHGTLADGTEVWGLQCWLDNRDGELTKNGKKTKTVTETMPKLANGNITFYAQNIKSGSFVAYDFGIYAGTTAPTTYTPYIGQTNTLTLPGTVYGGEVDAVTGEGQETLKTITMDGTTNKFSTHDVFWDLPQNSAPGILDSFSTDCSHFPHGTFGGNTARSLLFTRTDLISKYFADADALNAYLAAQYAAGTPVQVCYKLAEPTPFTSTGAQAIPALAGVNTVLTDADSATVTGRADPIKRIEDLEDAVASQT